MRVVLDTNIIVSGLIAPHGPSARTLSATPQYFEMCVSPAVFAEYEEVFHRPRFFKRLPPRYVEKALASIRKTASQVHPTRTLKSSTHESDNRLYECADAAQADYLVTGNTKHFPVGYGNTKIVTPRQFLEIIAGQHREQKK